MTYLEKAKAFQLMMDTVGTLEAFEKYYAEDCQVTEMPTGEVRKGKDAQRKAIAEWFSTVEEFHGSGSGIITSNEKAGVTVIESWADITFRGGPRFKMKEVGIQQWKGDQIIDEKFYYDLPKQ